MSGPDRSRRSFYTELPAWIVFAYCFGLLFLAHRFFSSPALLLHHLDEAYVNAFAWRMNLGHMLPYVDAVSHRGPVMYWLVAIAQRFGSPTSWMPIRMAAAICGLSTVLFAFLAAARAGRALAGAIACLALAVVDLLAMWPIDGLAYNGEQASNAFMMAALLCLVAGLEPRARKDAGPLRPEPSLRLVAAAGALAMLNALSKQLGAVAVATMGIWVIMTAWGRPGLTRRKRLWLVGAYGGGALLVLGAVIARYAAAGEVKTFIYYLFQYNADVYLAPYSHQARVDHYAWWIDNHAVLFGILGPLGMWATLRPVSRGPRLRDLPRAYDEDGFVPTVGISALALALVCNAAMRDFTHYYLQAVPWLGLLLGVVVDSALATPRPGLRDALVRLLIAAPVLLLLDVSTARRMTRYAGDIREKKGFGDGHDSNICKLVHSKSRPEDALFLWGFDPKYYTACARRPASRYVFTTFVAGYVPWFDSASKADDEARAVPGSRELLIADLEATRPPIILDMPRSMGNRSMRRYEKLAHYLTDHYCPAGKLQGDVDIYLRRNEKGACPPGSK